LVEKGNIRPFAR